MSVDWAGRAQELTLCARDLVDGQWRPAESSRWIAKYAPRDGQLLYRVGVAGQNRVEEAVCASRRAFIDGRWSTHTMERRKAVLYRLADLVLQHREELALLECLDVGKPISEALNVDVPMAASVLRHFAESAGQIYGKVYGVDQSSLSYQLHRPVGVVAAVVGWNFPLVLAAGKIAPALATGNCLVIKPSELTSLSAGRLAELALEAGVPEGVLNVIHGDGSVGTALAVHGDVDLVSFTGSTATGKRLLISSGQSNMKRLILECGGKAPNIIFDDDFDLDAIADAVIGRAFWNQGQVCTASSRLLIQESIKESLLPLIIQKTARLLPGDPLSPDTRFAALVSREHKQKVQSYIDVGAKEGAELVYQSNAPAPKEGGFYVGPAIFDAVSSQQKLAQEEVFGPVLSIISFRDEREAIDIANSTIYGLSAILWTTDLARAHRVTHGIQAGWIAVNATAKPTGGPEGALSVGGHKQSGIGVEGGIDGLRAYTTTTAVQVFV